MIVYIDYVSVKVCLSYHKIMSILFDLLFSGFLF